MRTASIYALAFAILLVSQCYGGRNGNRNDVENMYQLAFDHGVKVREEGACRDPKPRIVYADPTNPSKIHLPRGTILHRCSDETGCCAHATQTCQAIESEIVDLYFLTLTLLSNATHRHHRIHSHQRQGIEKLSFTNHTLCGCRQIGDNELEPGEADAINEV